jgi:hypothetical protein
VIIRCVCCALHSASAPVAGNRSSGMSG